MKRSSSINGTGVLLQAGTSLFPGTSGNDHLISKGVSRSRCSAARATTPYRLPGGSSITLVAGSGNGSLSSLGGTYISMLGGARRRHHDLVGRVVDHDVRRHRQRQHFVFGRPFSITLVAWTGNFDTLSSSGGTYISMLGGSGNDTMPTTGGSSITMFGGTRNDTLSAKASGSDRHHPRGHHRQRQDQFDSTAS